ncbi:MAG: TIGR01777 family oxidoreductase [Verrucomicrobiota bacterium]
MNSIIVIFGANGFLGRYLSRYFARQGKEVVCIARNRAGWSGDGMFLEWNGRDPGPWTLALEGAACAINLSGHTVNCRYHEENRRRIIDSRVESTRAIGDAIAACKTPPACWINSSSATWYRHATDRPQNEWTGEPGDGFSVDVVRRWEETFFSAAVPAVTRKVALRTGIVLANEPGSAFDVMHRLIMRGLGGPMGDGRQRMSWLHMDDFLRAIAFLENPLLSGVFNLTAPTHPDNRAFMQTFREACGMPAGLPATAAMIRLGARFMKTEPELVLKSRWVYPTRLQDEGFRWRWSECPDALANLLTRPGLERFFRPTAARPAGARAWLPTGTR